MDILIKIIIGFVAFEHLYFLYIEMFAWETKGKATFKSLPADLFTPTKGMAANQGLYNGFLAAGLIWSLFIQDLAWQSYVAIFFLTCVVVAGIFGGITVSKKIFYIQASPALVALGLIIIKLA